MRERVETKLQFYSFSAQKTQARIELAIHSGTTPGSNVAFADDSDIVARYSEENRAV